MQSKMVSTVAALALVLYPVVTIHGEDHVGKDARITVLTSGEICTVYIDGEEAGESPLSTFVTPGSHRVEVVAYSGETKEKTVKAKANAGTIVRFKFPLPEPVKAALKGDFDERTSWSLKKIGIAIGGVCIIGGAVVLAYNYGGSSGGLSAVHVSRRDIDLSVESNLDPADDDMIDLTVNGSEELGDYDLSGGKTTVSVNLDSGSNVVEIVAENEGTEPPNTGILTISDVTKGRSTQHWRISAGSAARMIIVAP